MAAVRTDARDYSPALDDSAALQATVPQALAGLRLDQALSRLFPDYSRSRLAHWVKGKRVQVDGRHAQPADRVWGGEQILVVPTPEPDATHAPEAIALAIVHEDRHLLVIDKPAGLVVHPGSGNLSGTMMNALLHHAPQLASLPRAGIVHRLDKDTSGLLVVAKTLEAQTALVRQLQARTVRRDYLALVSGRPTVVGRVEAPIGRHPVRRTRMAVVERGRPAVTNYKVIESGAGWSLVQCSLETGRTHQIRVHLHAIGHPLIGDPAYGARHLPRTLPAEAKQFGRQALHAWRLGLEHPASGEPMTWEAPLPADMARLLEVLRRGPHPALANKGRA